MQSSEGPDQILAIDLGLRCGFALFGADGRLRWHRSQRFADTAALKRGVARILSEAGPVTWLFTEGDVRLAAIWERAAMRQGIRVQRVSAEIVREHLRVSHEDQGTPMGRQKSIELARRVAHWSGCAGDEMPHFCAAEAVLIGLWAVQQLGWLQQLPGSVGHMTDLRVGGRRLR